MNMNNHDNKNMQVRMMSNDDMSATLLETKHSQKLSINK